VYCRSDHFTRWPDLKIRRMQEWDRLLVYTPHRPSLHQLNAEAWLVFELADGRGYEDIFDAYREVAGDTVDDSVVRGIVDRTLHFLEQKQMVRRQRVRAVAPSPSKGGEFHVTARKRAQSPEAAAGRQAIA
jgi:hypothetical protein